MKSKNVSTLIAIFTFLLSCSLVSAQRTEERKVKSFHSINLSVPATVYVKQEKETSIKIKGYPDDLEKIVTKVTESTLKIKRKKMDSENGTSHHYSNDIEIYISTPNLENLKISGSGTIIAKAPIKSGKANYMIIGSGNITIKELMADDLKCCISGSGYIRLKGKCEEEFKISISGSGDIEAYDFKAKYVNVKVSGSGNCKVRALNKLTARTSGSGDIYYRGKPEYIDCKYSGSGSIKSIDK